MSMFDIRCDEYLLSYFSKLFSSIVEDLHFYKTVVLVTGCFFLYNEAISLIITILLERKELHLLQKTKRRQAISSFLFSKIVRFTSKKSPVYCQN